jgi:putative salt-induced outer membrane protein
MTRHSAMYILLLFPFSSAVAEQAVTNKWSSDAEFGVVLTQGNTQTQNINVKLNVLNERLKWRHEARLEALNNADDEQTTAERYTLFAKTGYKFGAKNYAFGTVNYENDRFSGYQYRVSEAVGFGRRLIQSEALTLAVEFGPGARQSKLETGDSENEGILHLAGNLKWTINPKSQFLEELTIEAGKKATISKSITGVKTNIAGDLAMKLSLTVNHISEVPPETKKTDSELTVTLVYSIL